MLVTLITVRELGAGGATAAVIAGQLALSVVIDRAGVLGLDERAITWEKCWASCCSRRADSARIVG